MYRRLGRFTLRIQTQLSMIKYESGILGSQTPHYKTCKMLEIDVDAYIHP